MPVVELITIIYAPIERVFDLSRSIDLHVISQQHAGEKPIGGRTSGLIELDEYVLWEAKHFGIRQQLSSKITDFEFPTRFVDEQVKGAFKSFRHQHLFREDNSATIITDRFEYETPFGIFGRLFSKLVLHRYIDRLLSERNAVIKRYAESEKWKEILSSERVIR